jgi:hypothetical protein
MFLHPHRTPKGVIIFDLPRWKTMPSLAGLDGTQLYSLAEWDNDKQLQFHELASFLEYDCGLDRATANNEAFKRLDERIRRACAHW